MRLKRIGLPIALAVLATLVLVPAVWSFSKWFSPVTGYSDQDPDWWLAEWMWSDSVSYYYDCQA
jgi:ABC-type glycerol-3-phosphate transport system permease component